MALYLFLEGQDGALQSNTIRDYDRGGVVKGDLRIFRFREGRFEQLVVDISKDDDYNDTWTPV
jgi:hypothetical protein